MLKNRKKANNLKRKLEANKHENRQTKVMREEINRKEFDTKNGEKKNINIKQNGIGKWGRKGKTIDLPGDPLLDLTKVVSVDLTIDVSKDSIWETM